MAVESAAGRRRTDIETTGTARQPGEVFVGREPLLEALRNAFRSGQVAVADTCGIPGSGKSRLLLHAKHEIVGPTDLALRYQFSVDDVRLASADAQEIADYGAFQAFAQRVAEDVKELLKETLDESPEGREARLFRAFELAYDAARVSSGPISTKTTVLFSIIKNSDVGGATDTAAVTSVREKRPCLAAALAALLRGLTQESPGAEARRILLALDEFEWVPPGPLRNWVLQFVGDLDSALVLVPRNPNLSPPEAGVFVGCPLGRLSRNEIRSLAEQCVPRKEIPEELLAVIERATEGHPQAVGLAVELLQRYEAPDTAAFAAELESLPTDLAQRHSRMVEKILGRDGVEAEETLRACAVMRKFDAAMLEAVVGRGADIDGLRRYSFVEDAPDPRHGFLRIHPVVRKELAQRLEQADQPRFVELHARAAAHCASWVGKFEVDDDVDPRSLSYSSWYRYEDPRWQAAKREWLYHQAGAGSRGKDERELGRLRLCRVFFDAFWWEGCYIDFPFCRALVEDWRATQEDREWTDLLKVILEAYPHGYEKDKAPHDWREGELPRWAAVRSALLGVTQECGLAGDPAAFKNDDRRHTRALIDNFLAHTFRYEAAEDAAYASALALYDEAVKLFEGDKDDWDTAWTRFELSELHHEHGNVDAARADWAKAAKLVPKLKDEELAANLHRLAADAHAECHNVDAAFGAQGRAVLHAYLFQRRPHPPDEYTLAFYTEQVARALDRLVVHARDGGDAGRAAELLTAPFPGRTAPVGDKVAALCRETDLAGLSAALFPDPPSVDELNRRCSKFVQRWLLAEAELQLPEPVLGQSAW